MKHIFCKKTIAKRRLTGVKWDKIEKDIHNNFTKLQHFSLRAFNNPV